MDIICMQGAAPGPITATVAHEGMVRQLVMEVARHDAGGWKARRHGAPWGLRCHAVATAVLLEASEAFAKPPVEAPAGYVLAAD